MNEAAERQDTPRPGTTHPHLARERALKVLFAADVRGVDPRLLLDEVETHPADLELLDELEPDQEQVAGDEELQLELTRRQRLPVDDYTRLLVAGVAAHRPVIDELLGEVAERWAVHRMPAVDRNLLRLAVFELAEQDTPHAVVIDEAVSLAIAFAGEKARSFVNGVLETVRQQVVAGEVDLGAPAPVAAPAAEPAEGLAEPDDDAVSDGTATDAAATPARDVAEPDTPRAGDVGEDVAEPELTAGTDTVEEVDEAAQEAYDLAIELLGAQDADLQQFDEMDDDVDQLDDEMADEDDRLLEELEGADLRDEDEALW